MEVFYSTGWKKPYCYTIKDMHGWLKKPINDKTAIMDGGYYYYKGFDKEQHIKWLCKSKLKFLMGFDGCDYKEREQLINLMIKNKINIYPIVKTLKDWKWFLKNKWKVEGISTSGFSDEVIDLAYKRKLNIHHLGRVIKKEHLEKVTSIDINPYESPKSIILNLGNIILPIKKEVLQMGEFILYGSSLFVNNNDDYDLLYYGKYTEEEVTKAINMKNVSVTPFNERDLRSGKITHLLYAMDNGVKLTDCSNLEKYYKSVKKFTLKQILNKSCIAYTYYKDGAYDKELKTLIVGNYYKSKRRSKFIKFIYDRVHLIYKITSDNDEKAWMFLNRMLFSRFKRNLILPNDDRRIIYRYRDIKGALDLFFPKVKNNIDSEQFSF